jgi:hypothetical protein
MFMAQSAEAAVSSNPWNNYWEMRFITTIPNLVRNSHESVALGNGIKTTDIGIKMGVCIPTWPAYLLRSILPPERMDACKYFADPTN